MLPLAHVGAGALALGEVAAVLVAAALYWRRSRTLARQGRPVPTGRQLAYYGGIALLALAVTTPLAHVADELFVAHMAEHLLLGDVATLLIAVGLTGPVLAPVLRAGPLDRLRVLSHPLIALPLWAANLYVWHLPALHQGALDYGPVHALQHALFVALGVNMWLPLFGPLPRPAWFGTVGKLAYIVAVRLIGAVLGNVLTWSGTVFYSRYAPGEAFWGIAPLRDQGSAGLLMMVEGSLLTIILFGWLFVDAARQGEERQELLDLAAARGVALTAERAARAVAAGRGEDLRRRLEDRAPGEDQPDDDHHGHHDVDEEPEGLRLRT